jgi:hypothetical protein
MTAANQTRRQVMLTAWTLWREGRQLRDGRTFGQCLRWAWAHVKREAAKAAFAALTLVKVAPAIRSPIARRTYNGRLSGAARDFRASYLTARVGA